MNLHCPKCNTELVQKFYKGMFEIDACPNCMGMWLDLDELDKMEDLAFQEDAHKGSLIHFQAKTNYPCPHCGTKLEEFQYRLYELRLDACMENSHGFWLDAGEDQRVLEVMEQRAKDTSRKINAEAEWKQALKNMHSLFRKK